MVDEFQHIVYANPDLTPAQRGKKHGAGWKRNTSLIWIMKGMNSSEREDTGQQQHHIYSFPFYYIDYVIAQTVAFEYKLWMDEDFEAAWKSYLKLCRLSATRFL